MLRRRLLKEPGVASTLTDGDLIQLLTDLPSDSVPRHYVIAETWLRFWLYAEKLPLAVHEACEPLFHSQVAGFSTAFQRRFTEKLQVLRKNDLGDDLPRLKTQSHEEVRIWGLLTARIRSFLETDGLIPLIRNNDAVAVPFRFSETAKSACFDARNQAIPNWTDVVKDLGAQGVLSTSHGVRIDAVFPEDALPQGRSLALPLAIAWSRREACDVPLFPPLMLLATGDLSGQRIGAVRGTGGETPDDVAGGGKTELAKRLGVRFFVAVDLAQPLPGTKGMVVETYTSGASWEEARDHLFQMLLRSAVFDSPRHLRRVEEEDFRQRIETKAPRELWGIWRRLSRLGQSCKRNHRGEVEKKVQMRQRQIAYQLGFKTLTSDYSDFSIVEQRHPTTELPGRSDELGKLDKFLKGPPGLMLVTSPVGHGKSALLTHWRRDVVRRGIYNVFYHYFDQGDDRLQSREIFYRRLLEHLLLAAQTEEGLTETNVSDDSLLIAWECWERKSGRQPMVLIIDGLDEVGRRNDAGQNVAELCPSLLPRGKSLPAQLWVVASCRSGEDGTLHPTAQAWKKQAGSAYTEFPIEPLNKKGVTQWVAQWAAQLKPAHRAALPPMEELTAALLDRSDGVALSVYWLLDDLATFLREGRPWADVFDSEFTPKGVSRQILAQWKRLNDAANHLPEAAQAREIVLYLVAAAQGTLANGELVKLLDLSPAANLGSLYFEARRWVTTHPADKFNPKWGVRFSLNHAIVREAFKPISRESSAALPHIDLDDEAVRLGAIIEEHYSPRLSAYCHANWRDGSPYALRHLDENLIASRSWPELDLLVGDPRYLNLQRHAFPEEPGLTLGRVRRALDNECHSAKLNIATIAELVLTHAKIVRALSQPAVLETNDPSDEAAVLSRAEEMTRLPVQWEPAATRMWHLLAAWLHHERGNYAARDHHMRDFARSDQKITREWSLLAAILLPACFDRRDNLWLLELGRRCLPPDAIPHFVGQVAKGDIANQIAAEEFIGECVITGLLPEKNWFAHRAAAELISAWVERGDWVRARSFAQAIPPDNDLGIPVGRCLHLATVAVQKNNGVLLKEIAAFLKNNRARKMPKAYEVLGQVAAFRLGWIVATNGAAIKEISIWEELAEAQMSELGTEFPDKPFPAFVTIECALAEAFAGPVAVHHTIYAEEWRNRAVAHWQRAVDCWSRFKAWPGASTLEIFQHAMWLAQTTLHLTEQKVWPVKESARIKEKWVTRVRTVLGLEDDGAAMSEMLAIPATDTEGKRFRLMEPKEWDQAMVTAIDVLVRLEDITPAELAQTIRRACSAPDRAQAISRCLHWWQSSLPITVAGEKVTELLASRHRWQHIDRAYGWAHWARFCKLKGHNREAAVAALRSIEEGTPRPADRNAVSLAELAVTIGMQLSKGSRRDELCRQAFEIVANKTGPGPFKMNLWMDLASTASPDATWRNCYISHATSLLPRVTRAAALLEMNIQMFTNYARVVGRLAGEAVSHNALAEARMLADKIRTLSGRILMYCEIAESGVAAGFILDADILFREARKLVPSPSTGPLGSKVKELHGFLIAEWLSSVAKALTKAIGQRGLSQQDVNILRTWSDWVIEPSNRDSNWEVSTQDGGATLLNQLKRTEDRDEVMRARTIAASWRVQFDHTCVPEQRSRLMDVRESSLATIASPAVRTRTHRDLAIMEAYAAFYDRRQAYHALNRIRVIGNSAQKDDVLHRIGTAFTKNYLTAMVDGKSDASVHLDLLLSTISSCSESHTSAFIALANLLRCFPESVRQIDDVLNRRRILSIGSESEGRRTVLSPLEKPKDERAEFSEDEEGRDRWS